MERDDEPTLGLGEAAQGPTAAAIANAVSFATGQRRRRLPLASGGVRPGPKSGYRYSTCHRQAQNSKTVDLQHNREIV